MGGNIRHGFVYERVPHITLKSIANNAEIDVIWSNYQKKLEPCLSGYHPHPLYVVCLLGLQARAGAGALRRRSG